jgi:hypothetical protein
VCSRYAYVGLIGNMVAEPPGNCGRRQGNYRDSSTRSHISCIRSSNQASTDAETGSSPEFQAGMPTPFSPRIVLLSPQRMRGEAANPALVGTWALGGDYRGHAVILARLAG